MNLSSLQPARTFAASYGFKALVYGDPGSGKTPIINSAPRPVLLACEPGLRSMVNSNVPTWLGYSADAINEFMKWFFFSNETKNFDTLAIDSVSQMAEIFLQESIKTKKHGLQAYGDMAKNVMDHLRPLYFTPQKHTYLIAKQALLEDNGVKLKRPYFPGNQLNVEIPHMFDAILHLAIVPIPGIGQVKAFRTTSSMEVLARDRSGLLGEFEPPEFGKLVEKAMQQ